MPAGRAAWPPDPSGSGPRRRPRRIAVSIASRLIACARRAVRGRSGRRTCRLPARAGRVRRSSRRRTAACGSGRACGPVSPSATAAARVASRYSAGPAREEGPQRQVGAHRVRRQVALEFALAPVAHQLGQRDLHRADALAFAAEGGGVRQMAGLLDADQRRRQHGAHRPGIHPAIGVAADRAVNRAVVHAGGAADAAQHVLEVGAQHRGAAVVHQHDVVFVRTVQIARPPRAGGERGVDGKILPGRGARQHAQQRGAVLDRRHHLLDAGQHDVHARQGLRQVAVALVGDDDAAAGLGDQEVGAGDADIGGQEFLPQPGARLGQDVAPLVEHAVRPAGRCAICGSSLPSPPC